MALLLIPIKLPSIPFPVLNHTPDKFIGSAVMRIPRLFVPDLPETGTCFFLPEQSAHYVSTVLRLKAESELVLFCGDSLEYSSKIQDCSKRKVSVLLGEGKTVDSESPLKVHIGIGLTRGERMDYAIQKATELGVTTITPLFTERCEVKLKADRVAKRLAHWQQVAISASEQSGRTCPPQVSAPVVYSDWIKSCEAAVKLILDHRQSGTLPGMKAALEECIELSLVTGPEGGFTTEEIALAKANDFTAIALGRRVLRAETAPVAALSVLQYLWGDF